ncbi:hypothetical protein OE88DRAFT_1505828 [Heliocybe sulcata]|uniref:Uncharacterized protein n=1 Tax=Heliocybe sulcata TaxID=5364 RepID=A0A5C3N6G1_9AGAM|nr:hypothetical protein OE88DRAFT_1505828 [Heliocybe sulcata]
MPSIVWWRPTPSHVPRQINGQVGIAHTHPGTPHSPFPRLYQIATLSRRNTATAAHRFLIFAQSSGTPSTPGGDAHQLSWQPAGSHRPFTSSCATRTALCAVTLCPAALQLRWLAAETYVLHVPVLPTAPNSVPTGHYHSEVSQSTWSRKPLHSHLHSARHSLVQPTCITAAWISKPYRAVCLLRRTLSQAN